MIQQSITIQNKLGLHTRAAAKLVDIAKKFSSKIDIACRSRAVDAKSIMGVITLGAHKGSQIDIAITGEDEQEAMVALVKLVNERFGEAE